MSTADMNATVPDVNWDLVQEHKSSRDCTIPMGITSENVASKYGISREAQDMFAVQSHAKAARAQQSGSFNDEIAPVQVTSADGSTVCIDCDDGIRADTSLASLARLKPAFDQHGTTTAGNSSQVILCPNIIANLPN